MIPDLYINLFFDSLRAGLKISLIILILMIIVEYLVTRYKDKIVDIMSKNRITGYIMSSFFGAIPGCAGVFAMDSLYMAGYLSFGGIIAAMIATMGDETFILLTLASQGTIPLQTVGLLISSMFILAILGGYLADCVARKTNLKLSANCEIKIHKNHCKEIFDFRHFMKEHVYGHIIKKHIINIFIWIVIAVFLIGVIQNNIGLVELITAENNMIYILVVAAVIGILPISGPNIILLTMFANGMIPFSVLLANSIIQDGHGLLPILGYSVSDSIKIKLFNFIFGLTVGLVLLLFGL